MVLNGKMMQLIYSEGFTSLDTEGWRIYLLSAKPGKIDPEDKVKSTSVVAQGEFSIRVAPLGFQARDAIVLEWCSSRWPRRRIRSAVIEHGDARIVLSAGRANRELILGKLAVDCKSIICIEQLKLKAGCA